jgi:hypothetical protein
MSGLLLGIIADMKRAPTMDGRDLGVADFASKNETMRRGKHRCTTA